MRPGTGLSRAEFTLLARPRATSRATDSLYLFESRPLSLHGWRLFDYPHKENGQFRTVNSDNWRKIPIALIAFGSASSQLVKSPDFVNVAYLPVGLLLGLFVQLGRCESSPSFWTLGFVCGHPRFVPATLAAMRNHFIAVKVHGIGSSALCD
jgi:hypothetical protein